MDFPAGYDGEYMCQFNGLDTMEILPFGHESVPIAISKATVTAPNGEIGIGWFGGFDYCIIDSVVFDKVEYCSQSWKSDFNDEFYRQVSDDGMSNTTELFLPHMCHSRISNSSIGYYVAGGSRSGSRSAGSKLVTHDRIRLGNVFRYINCHIGIYPTMPNNPNQSECLFFFEECYFENCTFDIHKESNVEFPNCVFNNRGSDDK